MPAGYAGCPYCRQHRIGSLSGIFVKERSFLSASDFFQESGKLISKDLPFLLESSDIQSSAILEELAASIGAKTYFVSTEQRIMLHLAAVFICNFTNHMLTGGKLVAEKAGYSV